MAFIDKILQVPEYGWKNSDGELVKPTKGQIMKEVWARSNIFKTRKNWIAPIGWLWVFCLIPAMVVFITSYFQWYYAVIGLLYGMIIMSTHGTVWYHRYSTHKAFKFSNKVWRFIVQNLVIKVIPEEIYVVSHHVHHARSDKAGDPYNASCGFLYCFLADITHQPIAKDLNLDEYTRTAKFLAHTGIYINSYKQYQKWGSVGHPFFTMLHIVLNWAFWYGDTFPHWWTRAITGHI